MWCHLSTVADQALAAPPSRGAYLLLSASLFYVAGYVKTYKDHGARDETALKQRMFLEVADFYLRFFELPAAQRHVRLRLYVDVDSLLAYRGGAWRAALARMARCPYIQLVRFDAPDFRDGASHRGLLGAMMRFHALFADPAVDLPAAPAAPAVQPCVCLVDFDNVYAPAWWAKQFAFARGSSPALAITGPSELGMYGFVPPGETVLPFLRAGLATFRRGVFDRAATWDAFARDLADRGSFLARRIDAAEFARYQEIGSVSLAEPLYRDFGYGFDEVLLNAWAAQAELRPRDVRVLRTFRPRVNPGFFLMDRVVDAVRWNGARSVAARAMARAAGHASVGAWVKDLERRRDALVPREPGGQIVDEYARDARSVQDYFRPHLPRLADLYIDGRLLHVLADPTAFDPRGWIPFTAFLARATQGPVTLDYLSRGTPVPSR